MSKVSIGTGKNFAALDSLANKHHPAVFCHEGGGRSGKTWDILFFLALLALKGAKYRHYDKVKNGFVWKEIKDILITSELWSWLSVRAWKDFDNIMTESGLLPYFRKKSGEHKQWICRSQAGHDVTFWFIGADDPKKFQGPAWDIAYINEAVPGFSKTAFDYIHVRTKWLTILDWNPLVEDGGHWAYELPKQPGVHFVKSTILENKFAPENALKVILGYEPTFENIQNGTANERLWKIFGIGERAGYQGLVYADNWFAIDERPKPSELRLVSRGIDWGYSNDPTAVVNLYKYSGGTPRGNRPRFFVETLYYSPNTQSKQLGEYLTKLKGFDNRIITACDHNNGEGIDILYNDFRINTKKAKKGADSIIPQTNEMKADDYYCLTTDPANRERLVYMYKTKRGFDDQYTNEPIDKNNHAMDAMRYARSEVD